MNVILVALVALALSTIPIVRLCLADPKRLRASGKRDGGDTRQRRWLAAAACVPGIACLLLGETAAFTMWLGGGALLGWAIAYGFSAGRIAKD